MKKQELIRAAIEAREKAYAPYSQFKVGAALLCENGKIYTGCNVENGAFSETVCAERVAICKAISDGVHGFCAIAIVGGREDTHIPCVPCGACRQVMSEHCDGDFKIILQNGEGIAEHTLCELLPASFSLK